MNPNKRDAEIKLLFAQIDQAYEKEAWHGRNLRGSIRGVSSGQAAWRPGPGRHNIWEIVVHAAYWKYAVRRRLLGEKRGSFPLKGSNWFKRPLTRTAKGWREDVALLDHCHRRLREAVGELGQKDLLRTPAGSKFTNRSMLSGIAFHDVYHAGQIQLLKRLMR